MICKITGGRYSFKKRTVIHESFKVEIDNRQTRFENVGLCLVHGYNECLKRGLDFEKLEIILNNFYIVSRGTFYIVSRGTLRKEITMSNKYFKEAVKGKKCFICGIPMKPEESQKAKKIICRGKIRKVCPNCTEKIYTLLRMDLFK